MKRSFVVVAAGLVFIAQPVKADGGWTVADFVNICMPGSLQPCASVIVKTQWNADAGETRVEMWVRNEQGSSMYDNTGGSFITQIGLTAPTIGTVSDFEVTIDGNVERHGNPNGRWSVDNGALDGNVTFGAAAAGDRLGGIRGCGDPAARSGGQYFTTCGADAGYVVFSFTTDTQLTEAPGVAVNFESLANGNGNTSVVCRTDEGCVSVTPEPSTYVLLLTGLVGVFGMSWVRRRREEDAA